MPKRNLIVIVAILAAAIILVMVNRGGPPVEGTADPGKFGDLAKAMREIQQSYYHVPSATSRKKPFPASAPSDKDLMQAMVRGMISSLGDEYSYYIPPLDVDDLNHRLMGRTHSLGLRLETVEANVVVIGAMVNSPAFRAGISRGSRLTAIDDVPLRGKTLGEVTALLEGKVGTQVHLDLIRPDGRPEAHTLTREEFPIESVQGLCRDGAGQWVYLLSPADRLGYIRIREFVPETLEKVQSALREVLPLNGLLLDLRDNPGGEFNASLGVCDLFLRQGTMINVVAHNPSSRKIYAQDRGTCPDFPLVVLVNGNSASGAEIVAGALAVNDRAVLVGERTRGKGCMQRMISIGDLGQINITTAEFYVGDDQPVAGRGIQPHVSVPLDERMSDKLHRVWLDMELAAPVRTTTGPATTKPTTMAAIASARLVQLDPQLAAGLTLLQSPEQMAEILLKAREARLAAKASSTQPATYPTTDE